MKSNKKEADKRQKAEEGSNMYKGSKRVCGPFKALQAHKSS